MRGDISAEYAAALDAAAEKSGVDESVLSGEGLMHGRRVAVVLGEFALPGRLDRPRRRGPAGRRDRARHRARDCRCWPRRSAAAPGCRRARRRSCRWCGSARPSTAHKVCRPAVPRLPAPPHHRRRDGLVGLARPRHGRRARRPGRLPRARGSTRRCTASRSPRACRPPRTSTRTASSTPSSPPEEIAGILDRALDILQAPRDGVAAGARPRPRTTIPDVETWDAVTRSRRPDRPGVRRLLKYAASDVVPSTAPARARPTRGC